jgi:hypothetical protein
MLEQLTYKCCPDCGSDIKSTETSYKHVNGKWHETMVFQCNLKIVYSPNFQAEIRNTVCTRTDEYLERENKRCGAVDKLFNQIKYLDVDDDFKKKLEDTLMSI